MPIADVTVIGGGISGMLSAFYLKQAGRQVKIIERGGIGRESSWAGGGILSPLYPWRYPDAVTQLASWGQKHYPELSAQLLSETGIDSEYLKSGFLLLNVDDPQLAKRWSTKWQHALESIQTDEIHKLEPQLPQKYSQALWMKEVAQIRNPKLLQALKIWLEQNNVPILEQTEVIKLQVEKDKVTAIKTKQNNIKVEKLLVAGGAWTTKILDQYQANVNVSPVRGQMIMFNTPPKTIQRITILDDHYLIPRKDGRVLFGSTLEQVGFDKTPSDKVRDRLKKLAISMAPILKDMPIERHWAGLRPGSPNGIPYIGQHPKISNLYINAGQFRNGVVLGPASAKLLTQIITKDNLILDPSAYLIS